MMPLIKIFSLMLLSLFFFSACSIKEYHKSEAKVIILKTPQMKFSDTGYIRHNGDALELELYSAGQPIKHIKMHHLICVDEGCMTKSSFNREYLDESYPDDLLLHVSQAKPIFENKNLKTTDSGFEQKLKNSDYHITYRVNADEIYFKDRLNHILIRFKPIFP